MVAEGQFYATENSALRGGVVYVGQFGQIDVSQVLQNYYLLYSVNFRKSRYFLISKVLFS